MCNPVELPQWDVRVNVQDQQEEIQQDNRRGEASQQRLQEIFGEEEYNSGQNRRCNLILEHPRGRQQKVDGMHGYEQGWNTAETGQQRYHQNRFYDDLLEVVKR